MLAITRYIGEAIRLILPGGEHVHIVLGDIRGPSKARIWIEAPAEIAIAREEVYQTALALRHAKGLPLDGPVTRAERQAALSALAQDAHSERPHDADATRTVPETQGHREAHEPGRSRDPVPLVALGPDSTDRLRPACEHDARKVGTAAAPTDNREPDEPGRSRDQVPLVALGPDSIDRVHPDPIVPISPGDRRTDLRAAAG